ncbi:phage major capsid protein [Aliiglaciecola sp. CAU 1673]|uniref:phage major capsid protein n=1 Tax=Aliiglaciecola sp. CAU 1673 TaxID=3032595 RepID=UPI0023DC31AF|nr:phage major capsid protein [Aliiglaciecola sp. CAU 1673]MDF2176994.1 phage major capsid protein [Aliiglaciecola sp. CAU 1673]
MQLPTQNRSFAELLDNAQPEQIPTFDQNDNFKGFRQPSPSTLSVSINAPLVQKGEEEKLQSASRSLLRDLTVANSPDITNSNKRNDLTWRQVIVSSNVLTQAGMSIDTSGLFEGTPFIGGFSSSVNATWLGENAEIPESTPATVNFPYQIHTIGVFSLVSRRMRKLVPALVSELNIAQAKAIREQLEIAFLTGDSSINPDQPDGLLKSISQTISPRASMREIFADTLSALETNKIGIESLSAIVSVDVAKKMREETSARAFKNMDLNRVLVSSHLPTGTLVAGRFSDLLGVTGNQIEFLAHSYTPEGQPEAGMTRVRSMFDADCLILNQDSFVKVDGIV